MFYKHRSTTPDWVYQHPNLNADALPEIKKELIQLFKQSKHLYPDPYTTVSRWMQLSLEQSKDYCPLLMQELDRLGLQKNLTGVAFISVVDAQAFGVHVDEEDDIALNIPLVNCSGTYTVWYDCKFVRPFTKWLNDPHIDNIHKYTEIDRIEANVPYWINTNVLHQPVATHNNFRLAASLRFNPAPLDHNGQLWPHLVASDLEE